MHSSHKIHAAKIKTTTPSYDAIRTMHVAANCVEDKLAKYYNHLWVVVCFCGEKYKGGNEKGARTAHIIHVRNKIQEALFKELD